MPRIYTTIPPIVRFWPRVTKTPTCWLWTGSTNPDGYGKFQIGRKTVAAHRFSWELHRGPIPEGLMVLHSCPEGDNPACVNPAHLRLGTHTDNTRDAVERGQHLTGDAHPSRTQPERLKRGEANGAAKLTTEAVREIRRQHAAGGTTYAKLGAQFGVSTLAIQWVVRRITWRHVT